MWLSFIERVNGSFSFGKNIWLSNREIKHYTDSAGNPELGCGVYFSGRRTFFQWPSDWRYSEIIADITFLELVPIVLSVFIFKEVLSMKQSLFYTDNEALFAILNTKNGKIKASDAVDSSLRFIYNALRYAIQKSSYRGPL